MFHFTENWDEWQGDYYEQDELQTEETTGKLRCTACLCGENLYEKLLLFYSFIFSFIFSFILVSEPHCEDPGFNVSAYPPTPPPQHNPFSPKILFLFNLSDGCRLQLQ